MLKDGQEIQQEFQKLDRVSQKYSLDIKISRIIFSYKISILSNYIKIFNFELIFLINFNRSSSKIRWT